MKNDLFEQPIRVIECENIGLLARKDINTIEPSPRQAAGNVLPETAVLRNTVRMKIDL